MKGGREGGRKEGRQGGSEGRKICSNNYNRFFFFLLSFNILAYHIFFILPLVFLCIVFFLLRNYVIYFFMCFVLFCFVFLFCCVISLF